MIGDSVPSRSRDSGVGTRESGVRDQRPFCSRDQLLTVPVNQAFFLKLKKKTSQKLASELILTADSSL